MKHQEDRGINGSIMVSSKLAGFNEEYVMETIGILKAPNTTKVDDA